jgi:hypothetical protein
LSLLRAFKKKPVGNLVCQDHANLIIEQYIQEGMEFINENSNEEREEIFNIMQQEKKQCQSMKVVNFFTHFIL